MKLNTAIILAGGLGTRLQSVVRDLPKCMAPVNGRPFIDYVIKHLQKQGITHFVFALGVKAQAVQSYLMQMGLPNMQFSIEEQPFGTGGAVKKAIAYTTGDNVLIVNGDTLFTINTQPAFELHTQLNAECTLVLKPMTNFNRFGTVLLNQNQRVLGFQEKQPTAAGLTNGGMYILQVKKWMQHVWPVAFSFETDYLQQFYPVSNMIGQVQDAYFIDIGIPDDFLRAQTELRDLDIF
jgi:D-glycero-alpha-D-manno-heptose 1-phosphate guanylyltransferase